MRMTPDTEESVRCTESGCSCSCFKPGTVTLRSCDRCGHGWVAHALAKLQFQAQPPSVCGPVEVALPGLVFDLSSLVLYGAQAVPVRLKILLDRLYSVLAPEQVGHILHALGWSLGDYVRGYMLQHPGGLVLDRWLMVTTEEELLILKQFLRFGETRPIVELMTRQCLAAVGHRSDPELSPAPKSCQSNTFVERSGEQFRNTRGDPRFKKNSPADDNDAAQHFENVPGGPSLLLPFHFPSPALHCLAPPTKELVSPGKLTQCLRRLSGTKLSERHKQDSRRRDPEDDVILHRSEAEAGFKIKADPDRPNPARSVWHRDPRGHSDHESDPHRGPAKRDNTSSLSASFNSSFAPSSSHHPGISSSSASKIPQKLHSSSSFSLSPLPSFSSSFLCPLPTSSFSSSLPPLTSSSSSLRPLPSSLCSLPSLSPAGGRKGRVCCGVCGKSFYDKGTLKIHYNAVHLKIKHRCTVAGCTMVFSSLRSRNRHSANPNPRLHTGAGRDAHRNAHSDTNTSADTQTHNAPRNNTHVCKDKDVSDTLWQQEDDAHTCAHAVRNGLNGHMNAKHGCGDDTPPQAPPPPFPQTRSQDAKQHFTPSDSRSAPHLPVPPPPPLLPLKIERCRHPLHTNHMAPPSHTGPAHITTCRPGSHDCEVTESRNSPPTTRPLRWESGDPVPKKKPRKSSMPVKIEREKAEGTRDEEEEEG